MAALVFFRDGHIRYQIVLPFGCHTSPSLFNDFATLLRHVLRVATNSPAVLNYLDHFWGGRIGSLHRRGAHITKLLKTLSGGGRAPSSREVHPSNNQSRDPGITVDARTMTYNLPNPKLRRLRESVASLLGRLRATRWEILSVRGFMAHACRYVPPGRGFLRRLLDAAYSVEHVMHRVRRSRDVRADLRWWKVFVPRRNGTFRYCRLHRK